MFRQQFMLMHIVKRYGHGKTHWSVKAKLKTTSQKAMQHFDDFYGSVYNERWRSIRAALLTEHKYTAVINFFGDVEKTKLQMECDGAINIRHLYQAMQNEDLNPKLNSGRMKYLLNSGPQGQTALEKSMQDFVHKQRSSEIQSMYEQNVEDGLEKFGTATETDVETENSRAKEPLEMAKFNKSLEEMVQKSGLDLNRMIEPEVGTAGLQEFVPATKLKGMEDFLPESHHYKYYSTTVDFPLKTELEANFTFPEHLEVYTFEHGNVTRFRRPSSSETGAFTHFLMDGASLLPPLLLDVQPGEVVLDACAAPGGKSLVLLQTLRPKQLVCNEMYDSRLKRIKNLMKQYVPDFDKQWKEDRCVIRRGDASYLDEYDHYDRVLVDVPCTTDRHSVICDDNNIFRPDRIKERLRIPELQSSILINCMRLLKPGGSLVYSTCSLSPIQNDGVVHMALSKAFTDYNITFTIKDLSHIVLPLKTIYRFENPKELKYGQLVLPFLPANFGPMYISKMTRNT